MSTPHILITGASSGIGEATTCRLARKGFRLTITGRVHERLEHAADVARTLGAHVVTHVGDLRDLAFLTMLEASLLGASHLSGIVNCAGIGTFGKTADVPLTAWDEMMATNMRAVFQLSQMAARLPNRDALMTIVNLSSDADTVGFAEAAAYCASKAGLRGLTRALQAEFRTLGIRLCVVSPGRVDTRFNNRAVGDRPGALSADDVAEVVEFVLTCSPNLEVTEIRVDSMTRIS